MIRLPWTKLTAEAQQVAEQERIATAELKRAPSEAVHQARRVIQHAQINGWTRIAKEIFAS